MKSGRVLLGKEEVERSILSCSTSSIKAINGMLDKHPLFPSEQSANNPQKSRPEPGENPGTLFA